MIIRFPLETLNQLLAISPSPNTPHIMSPYISRRTFLRQAGTVAAAAGTIGFPSILLPKTNRKLGVALVGLGGYSTDRKSTRLNSSHVAISYAVFCLKKKKKYENLHKSCNRNNTKNINAYTQ